jgi:hypothetical protein
VFKRQGLWLMDDTAGTTQNMLSWLALAILWVIDACIIASSRLLCPE